MIEKLIKRQRERNSKAAGEIVEEIAERVLRNLAPPEEQYRYFPLAKAKSSGA
jgi:hypothetical protein